MIKAYKFRLYPNKIQTDCFNETIRNVKTVYNLMLKDKIVFYKKTGKHLIISPNSCKAKYPQAKKLNADILYFTVKNLASEFDNFMKHPNIGYPRYKDEKSKSGSFTVHFKIKENKLNIPLNNCSSIKMKMHRQIPRDCELKSATIVKTDTDKCFVNIITEVSEKALNGKTDYKKVLGIKYSKENFFISSDNIEQKYFCEMLNNDGRSVLNANLFSFSSKPNKCEKVLNKKRDLLHKISTDIADTYDCVCVERGFFHHKDSWDIFLSFLEYKMKERGKAYVEVYKKDIGERKQSNAGPQLIREIGYLKLVNTN